MHIWIDGQCFQTASRSRGIGRYMMELLRALAERDGVRVSVSLNAALPNAALGVLDALAGLVPSRDIHVWHGRAEGGEISHGFTEWRALSEIALVHHVNRLAPDLALSASLFEGTLDPAVPFVGGGQAKVASAAIFYDAIPWRYPDQYLPDAASRDYYRRRMALLPGFDRVYAISDFAAREAHAIAGISDAVSIGAGISRSMQEIISRAPAVPSRNVRDFLYVGGIDWRKNLAVLIEGFARFAETEESEARLLVAGDHSPAVLDGIKALVPETRRVAERIVFLGHRTDDELVTLYRNALALIQPSFMEGFGLTALEAVHCGTPAIVAGAGAVPEIVGGDGLVFDPHSASELAELLGKVARPGFDRAGAVRRARRTADRFTWERAAELFVGSAPAPSTPPHRAVVDRAAAKRAAAHRVHPPREVAELLALAEPLVTKAPVRSRLFVEGSSTMLVDHKTGIQRVVNQISRHIVGQGAAGDVQILFCDDHSGWYAAPEWTGRPVAKNAKTLVRAAHGDTILMLDSSWTLHEEHRRLFTQARLRGAEIISCLYDTVPLRTPAFCDPGMPIIFGEWFRTALVHSSGFACISRAVADELHDLLEAIDFPRPMKIGAWQLGADFAAIEAPSRPEPKRLGSFLMVGTLEPRKGHAIALAAFERLWAKGVDAELVIVGKPGWGTKAFAGRLRSHLENGRRLVWHERVDDAALAALYARCDCLIAASFAEGFGLPIVEAGHFGKPVIASDIPVFREVAAGARGAHFFAVGSAEALANAVEEFLLQQNTAKTPPASVEWPNWRQSAAQLKALALGENWYRTYVPRERREYSAHTEMARPRMKGPLDPSERTGRFELIEGPVETDDGASLKITVRATNESANLWSSEGAPDGAFGVRIAPRVFDRAGGVIDGDGVRTRIPLCLAPGDPNYLAVLVPASLRDAGAAFVDVHFVQEGVAWFDDPLRVKL